MEGKKDPLKLEKEQKREEESKNPRAVADSAQSELDRLKSIEKAQIEVNSN